MLKLSRSGAGLLNSQYRSVLKKCMLLNILAGIMLASQPVCAKDAVINATGGGSTSPDEKVTEFIKNLTEEKKMGLQIGSTDVDRAVGTLYINGDFTTPMYSEHNSLPDYGPWLLNYKDLNIGYQLNNDGSISEVNVVISNRHNQNGDIPYFGGGVVANGGNSGHDATLKIQGTTFTNNSTSNDFQITGDGSVAAGGVISNFSQTTAEVKNSIFFKNFVMGGGQALGGAIYNGVSTDRDGNVDGVGSLHSTGNIYEGNYAGNDVPSGETTINPGGVIANKAFGGAIYNNANMVSTADRYINNYVKGKMAYGGAIYNDSPTIGKDGKSYGGNFELNGSGIINFSGNSAIGDGSNSEAKGGAIANFGNMTSNNNVFFQNKAEGTQAYGGAVYNSKQAIFNSNKEVYDRNYVKGEIAVGGAVYNGIKDKNKAEFNINGSVFSNNYAEGTGVQTGGGAVFNNGKLQVNGVYNATENSYTILFSNNRAISSSNTGITLGGAIENEGYSNIKGTLFDRNNVVGNNSAGGAVSFITNENSQITESYFQNNAVNSSSKGFGGAFSNSNLNATTTLTDTIFFGNKVISENEVDGQFMAGGAISNDNSIYTNLNTGSKDALSILNVIAKNTDVIFANNIVASSGEKGANSKYVGGAVYNGAKGQLTFTTSGKNIVFSKNLADLGGAIYSESDGSSQNIGGNSVTSYLLLNAENGNINFVNNKANVEGGALYNASGANGAGNLHSANGNAINFASNNAVKGGAISNKDKANFVVRLGDKGLVNFQENNANELGGAVYNEGKFSIENTNTSTMAQLVLQGNKAQKGGAIYNKSGSEFSGVLQKNTKLVFNGNTATSGMGGAIYNEAGGNVNISLKDTSTIEFSTTSDDVYNLGTVTITGDLANPIIPAYNDATTTAVDANKNQVVLNSTFGGNGTYNVSNTQLNIGSTGYIEYEPTMNLSNNIINLSSGSYLNLDSSDNLTNNDFDIAKGASLTYRADNGKPNVNLANTMVNSGLLNLGDGVLSNVDINTLTSNDGTIRIDVDNAQFKADVITINNKIYGTTNIVFDSSNSLALKNEKIYFAQTQADQSLSEYQFVSKINNGLYEINIGHDNNVDVNDWYFYRTEALNPEVIGYIDLPRASVEQTRSLLFDVARVNRGECHCYRDECNYKMCNFYGEDEKSRLWAKPVYRSGTYDAPVETDITMYGIDFGYDLQRSIRSQWGLFGSWRNGKYENNGKGEKYYSSYGSELDITSILGGIYYRHYFGNLYMSTAAYGGQQSVDVKADNGASASTDGLNLGAQAEIGYDIRTSKRSVLTPSLRASYDYIKFNDLKDNTGKDVEFDTINDIELEAGVKFEYQFNNERQLPTTGYIKPSVVQTISNGGSVKVTNVSFDETLENETYGRVEVGADAEIIENFSIGAFGNYTFGSEYNAWGIGGNVRYVW